MLKSSLSQRLATVFTTTTQSHHGRRSRKGQTELLEPRTLLTAGALDTSFDADGIVTSAVGSSDELATRVAIQSDGKIIAAGHFDNSSNWSFALVRYNTDGTLDASFDGGG